MTVVDLIDYLYVLKYEESDLLCGVKDVDKLIDALMELDDMVEMDKAKESIIVQIKHLIVSKRQCCKGNSFDGHLLHTVVNGPPGCGKTHLGKILGKIWLAIGVISNKNKDEKTCNCDTEEHLKFLKDYMLMVSEVKGMYENQINMKVRLKASHAYFSSLGNSVCKLKNDFLGVSSGISNKKSKKISKTFSYIMKEISDAKCISAPQRDIYYDQRNKFLERLDKSEEEPLETLPVKVVTRGDFVANYMGQTTSKTRKLLEANKGGILIIDEAYTLITSERDTYGMEALTELNVFMSEYSDEIIVVFLGYKDLLEETIFKAQPGLKSRCNWIIEVDGYNTESLSKIFITQMAKNGWSLDNNINLVDFFRKHKDDFASYGRDTGKLCFFCKLAYSESVFEDAEVDVDNKIVTDKILTKALVMLRDNKIKTSNSESKPPPPGLYY